jgi:sugar lactone lactonase YvrE
VAVDSAGTVVFAELGTGRVHALRNGSVEALASGLHDPVGIAFDPDGSPLVAETGRVARLSGSGPETVIDGLVRPQGILVVGSLLYIVDAGAKEIIAFDLDSKERRTIASGLPVGPPPGVEPKPLKGMPPFSGPQGPFAGITAGPDGTLYVSADGDGSVLALRRVNG